ncbi:hypothetical protein HPP92_025465 [Vanilla planifolia]|uniref:Uncharacterized protein n=1 Tax=Vanilla planifolia TaxID=51239 RepID=A0A835PHY9_VANPL|nr:hypothetical protein HPP92_025465 [Vanilla planifolia]
MRRLSLPMVALVRHPDIPSAVLIIGEGGRAGQLTVTGSSEPEEVDLDSLSLATTSSGAGGMGRRGRGRRERGGERGGEGPRLAAERNPPLNHQSTVGDTDLGATRFGEERSSPSSGGEAGMGIGLQGAGKVAGGETVTGANSGGGPRMPTPQCGGGAGGRVAGSDDAASGRAEEWEH